MVSPEFFVSALRAHGIDFYAGVPDSLLKYLCAYLEANSDDRHYTITADEGAAVALAAGYHLATGKAGAVFMQNSGEGNAVNPLASLTDKDVYGIPVLLIIGWRGRPGVHDEPQHVKQGKITTGLLDLLGIDYTVLGKDEPQVLSQLDQASEALRSGSVYAIVVEKDTFSPYALPEEDSTLPMSREEAVRAVAGAIAENDVIVSTTGMTSRELFEYRQAQGQGHERDFLTVGSMGHACQIALGIAMEQPGRRVWCLDGDGSVLMHMGSLAIIAGKRPANFVHVVFNNGAHDSVGGQPTVGLDVDFPAVALAVGYSRAFTVSSIERLSSVLQDISGQDGPVFLEVRVHKGNRKDIGRPTTTPAQNKEALMEFLRRQPCHR